MKWFSPYPFCIFSFSHLVFVGSAVAQVIIWLIAVFGVWCGIWSLGALDIFFFISAQDISINDDRMHCNKYWILNVVGSRLNTHTHTHITERWLNRHGVKRRRLDRRRSEKDQNKNTQADYYRWPMCCCQPPTSYIFIILVAVAALRCAAAVIILLLLHMKVAAQ